MIAATTLRRCPAAVVSLLLAWGVRAGAQDVRFSTSLEAVRIDALVTDGGRVVRDLGREDFEVLDNGVMQRVDLVSFEELPLNVILALDTSASVSGERLDHLRGASLGLLDRLTPEDQAALLTFSHAVALREAPTGDVDRVRRALARVEPAGETALIDGVHAALVLGERDVGRDLLIVFSDGVDTSSWLPGDGVLESARRSDIVAYGVAVRGTTEPAFLQELSRLTGGTLFEVESTRDVSETFVRILDEFRQRYLISYSPRGVSGEGWHELEVRVRGRRVTVQARAGYVAD